MINKIKRKIKTFSIVKKYAISSSLEIIIAYLNKSKKIRLKGFSVPLSWKDAKDIAYAYYFGWVIEEGKSFKYKNKGDGRILEIPFEKKDIFSEDFNELYGIFDYKNKKVLDVGAYIGDTALFFLSKGAIYVEAYEPIKENVDLIKKNFKKEIKEKKLKILDYALYSNDGEKNFYVDKKSIGRKNFGIMEGKEKISIKTLGWDSVLRRGNYDIAKVDCEGGERYLAFCDWKLLKGIPLWQIETHNKEINSLLKRKFKVSGFKLIKEIRLNRKISIVYFKGDWGG
ncbi:FkbM family methyltransferase [Patescibacteria group bacterium]|nr:FkbM family methyltransferase [Patescibacteria group bacterium]